MSSSKGVSRGGDGEEGENHGGARIDPEGSLRTRGIWGPRISRSSGGLHSLRSGRISSNSERKGIGLSAK